MKIVLICILFFFQLFATSVDEEVTMSCYEIMKEIELLEEDRKMNSGLSVALFLTTGGINFYTKKNKEIDVKIKILKFKLQECE